MGYSSFLRPRAEALTGEIEGIIDLANIKDRRRRKLEARPELFFRLTYPTADIKRVIGLLDRRFATKDQTPGLFLFEGLKGSGKSHLLLLIYHLFNSQGEARNWLDRHGLTCRIPEGVVPVVNKFTDLPLLSVWDFVLEQVTGRQPVRSVLQPSLAEVEAALAGRQVVLIFDELEQGVRVLPNPAVKAQNIAFLQMLSEWGNRSSQVTLFASIYSDHDEPGATLKRVSACRVEFAHAQDRAQVVLHRIFENYIDFHPESAGAVVDSYLNSWRRHSSFNVDEHRQAMLEGYPFAPDLLDIMFHRIPARGAFQNVRGTLNFLAHLVRLTHSRSDIITVGQADISDREVAIRLSDLDPGSDLITRAQGNLEELKSLPFAAEVASATLLYTLAGVDSRTHGVSREELIRCALGPGADVNDFDQTLQSFQKYAAYFHSREGRYYFDREENADAKVEFRSLKVDDGPARELLMTMWKEELFREPTAVIWSGPDETRTALDELEKDRLRWILAPRRLAAEDREALYHGLGVRNQVVLLEPREGEFNLYGDPDLLKWAKRVKAADVLLDAKPDPARRAEYERIRKEDRGHILARIKRAGVVYVKFAAVPQGLEIEEEPLGTATSKEEVLSHLSQKVYPIQLLAEHLEDRLDQLMSRPVRDVDREYRSTLGFPVPTHAASVVRAVRLLCKDGKLSVHHNRGNFCGRDPALSETELMEAMLREPFEAGAPSLPGIGPTPPGPSRPPTAGPETSSPPPGNGPEAPPGAEPTDVPPPVLPAGPSGVPGPVVAGEQVSRRTRPQPGIGPLRQAVAALLQEYPSAKTVKARFTVFMQQSAGDLSSFPPAYRGSLAGPGELSIEIAVTKQGELTKAEVEQVVERLPEVHLAEYSADLTLFIPAEGKDAAPHP